MQSKNDISIEQLNMACRHYFELLVLGMTENIAIRQVLKMADIYAKMRVIGKCSVDRADEFSHWSIDALKIWKKAKSENPKAKYGSYVRVEHGTPRTQFTEIVLSKYCENKLLTVAMLEELIQKKWKVAVITLEEDRRLSADGGRTNKEFKPPDERWADAGIRFPVGSKPNTIVNPDKRGNSSQKITSNLKDEFEGDSKVVDITGRDYKIYGEALFVSLPMMLRYSLSSSNIHDVMRILERQYPYPVPLDGREIKAKICQLIKELEEGSRAVGHYRPSSSNSIIDGLITKYLDNLEKYTPRGYKRIYEDWKSSNFKIGFFVS